MEDHNSVKSLATLDQLTHEKLNEVFNEVVPVQTWVKLNGVVSVQCLDQLNLMHLFTCEFQGNLSIPICLFFFQEFLSTCAHAYEHGRLNTKAGREDDSLVVKLDWGQDGFMGRPQEK